MTKQLDEVIARVRTLSQDQQDEAAAWLREFVEQQESDIYLSPEQIAEVERRLDDDDVATDEEVAAFFQHMKP